MDIYDFFGRVSRLRVESQVSRVVGQVWWDLVRVVVWWGDSRRLLQRPDSPDPLDLPDLKCAMRHALSVAALLLAAGAPLLRAQGAIEALALINANVLSVADGTLQKGVTILLRDGRIESIATSPAPAGVRR